MKRTAAFATLLFLATCSHQSLPGDGAGGGAPAGSGGAGNGGAGGTGGSAGATAGSGGSAGSTGAGGTGGSPVTGCDMPNPAEACRTSANQCLPSTCKCSAGGWACTRDCGGGRACGGADAGANCPPTCFRAVRCVTSCGGPPVSFGCCSCVPPAFDDISCPKTGAFESFTYSKGGGLCPPSSDCSSFTELRASGLLRHDCMGQLPAVVHEAMVSASDRDAAIAALTDPALVALLDQPGPLCQPPTDVFEGMSLMAGGKVHKNSVTFCTQPPLTAAKGALSKLVAQYLAGKCPMR
jgi:hypothetical protein